ncbi:hypothetical protein ATO12_01870 [Aquimarina atlantica]|uniref:DUF2541 domain-containing protein n=1 Tax=Aquimarina atlantica TaxID=1317122 RepID=A0A023BZZ2_9FLAO|nr:DUF2541 family protein [Aquimarina atlantica]EZH75555.1 hypothetical protein ATO12_01870 [Aquimarina atlantica]
MKNITLQKIPAFLFLLITLLITSSFTSTINNWEHLGSRTVNYRLDKDVIKVTARKGGFKKLKVKVTGGSLNMHKMVIQYGNGKKDVIQLKHNFSRKSETRIIDLKGGKRIIRDITFFYDTKNLSRKKAKVHVFGKH